MTARFVPFQSTLWTVIEKAGRGDRASFDDFVKAYRRPLVAYLRAKGAAEQDAEDLVQEVFVRIFEKRLLPQIGELRGRFRSYLLGVVRNMARELKRTASARKRGGERVHLSLDGLLGAEDSLRLGNALAAGEPDEEFDRLWVDNLIQVAFERMKGKPHHDLLKEYTQGGATYEELGARRGMTEAQVRTAIETARKQLRKLVQDVMSEYVLSAEEYESEKLFLAKFLN